jgi:hypothetical protein
MDLVSLIVSVHRRLDAAELAHAFGGALALGFVATPRGTADIDVNVFVPPTQIDRIEAALEPLGYRRDDPGQDAATFGGLRMTTASEPFPLDVFPSLDDRYERIEERSVRHPFGSEGDLLPFLSAEDLCVFKLSFARPQDWVDLRAIAAHRPDIDLGYIEDQLLALRGPTMHPRLARLRRYLAG